MRIETALARGVPALISLRPARVSRSRDFSRSAGASIERACICSSQGRTLTSRHWLGLGLGFGFGFGFGFGLGFGFGFGFGLTLTLT